jgi:hypothetical protein
LQYANLDDRKIVKKMKRMRKMIIVKRTKKTRLKKTRLKETKIKRTKMINIIVLL